MILKYKPAVEQILKAPLCINGFRQKNLCQIWAQIVVDIPADRHILRTKSSGFVPHDPKGRAGFYLQRAQLHLGR
jgi:hypothetical protein